MQHIDALCECVCGCKTSKVPWVVIKTRNAIWIQTIYHLTKTLYLSLYIISESHEIQWNKVVGLRQGRIQGRVQGRVQGALTQAEIWLAPFFFFHWYWLYSKDAFCLHDRYYIITHLLSRCILICWIDKMEELHSLDIVINAFTVCCETCRSLFPPCLCPSPFNWCILTVARPPAGFIESSDQVVEGEARGVDGLSWW